MKEPDTVRPAFADANDPAEAHCDSTSAHFGKRAEPVVEHPHRDDLTEIIGRAVAVMTVMTGSGVGQRHSLARSYHTEHHAGLNAKALIPATIEQTSAVSQFIGSHRVAPMERRCEPALASAAAAGTAWTSISFRR